MRFTPWLCFAAYLALAFTVQKVYPFSTFEMYAAPGLPKAARLVARDSQSRGRDVEDFVDWRCERDFEPAQVRCDGYGDYYHLPYLDREAADWIASHPGDGHEDVALVHRIWRLEPGAGPPHEDCLVLRCRARRAP